MGNEVKSEPAFAVHAYPKGAAQGEFPVTVKAPIIMDGTTQEGVQPLLDMVKSFKTHSNTEVAEKEAERLQPYFSALSVYLTHALENAEPESAVAQQKETLKGLITPGKLSGLFNAMAAYTRNTFISDIVIMPESIRKDEGPAAHLFKKWRYDPSFSNGEHRFSFGFLQVCEGGDWGYESRSSTIIPTYTLDTGMMKAIEPHQPEETLRSLQAVLTGLNHDMLHHLHSSAINSEIAYKFISDGQTDFKNPIVQWFRTLTGERLEEWSQLSHGKVFMTPENDEMIKEVGARIDNFFDELTRIGKSLPTQKAHEVIDYFGTVMAQALTRAFPLNHPLMTQCLDRLQEASPLSETELFEDILVKYMGTAAQATPADVRTVIKYDDTLLKMRDGYRQQGCDLFPDDDKDVSYRSMKLLQLAKMSSEAQAFVPTPVDKTVVKLRAESDGAFLELVSTAAKVTGYRPG